MILCAAEDSPSSDVKLHSNPNSIPDIPSNTSSLGNDKEKKNNNNIVYFGQDDAPAIPQVTNDRTTLDQRIGQECTETGKVHGCDEQASFTTVKSVKKRLRSEDNVSGIATTLVPSLSLFSPESKNTLEPVVKAHRAEAKRIATISDKKNSDIPYDLPKIPPLERHIDSAYERIRCIGEGSYGSVYLARAKHSPTPKHVAIKILKRLESRNHGFEGFPITSIREIRILRYLATARKHAPKLANRVVRLEEVLSSHDLSETALIFEFMEYDLYKVLAFPTQLPEAVIALYTGQLLEGLSFIHQRCIMHRDLKSSNVLLNSLGELKLADFGMAREWRRDAQQIPMTPRVATLWYRAPELLLQRPNYNESVDIWSCGCIFAEMFLCRPLFRVIRDSKSQERSHRAEIAQLHCIFDTLGTPLETEWPDFAQHVQSIGMMVPDPNPNRLHEYMMEHSLVKPSEPALDLLSKMLSLAPKSRPSALELLKHLYFYQPEWMDRDSVQKQLRHKLERHSYCSSGFTLTLSSRNSSTHAGSSVDGRGCSKSSSNPNMTHRYAYSGHLVHSHSQVEPAASRPNAALHFTGNHRSRGGMLTPNGNRNQPVPIGRRHNSMKCTTSLPPDGLNHSRACPSIVPQNNMLDVRKISLGSVQPPSNIPFGGNSSALPPENSNNSSPSSQSGSKLRLTIGRMRAHDRIMTCQDVHERKVNEHDWLDHEVAKIVKDQNCGGSSSATYIPGGDGMGSQQNSVRNSLLEPFRGPNENMSTNPEHIDSQIDMPIKAMSSSNVACSPIKKNEQLSFRLRMTPRPLGGPCARPESKPQTNVSK